MDQPLADDDVTKQSGYHGTIDVAFDGDIAVITFDCGENRLNNRLYDKLHAALDIIESKPGVRGLVTTGRGKFFVWIRHLRDSADRGRLRALAESSERANLRLLALPFPTVCAVNGHAFAGGALLSLVHDRVVMQTGRGWWSLNEVHNKLTFAPRMKEIIRLKLGSGHVTHEAAVLGRRYTAQEACTHGLVQQACSPDQLLPNAVTWLRRITTGGAYDRDHFPRMRKDLFAHALSLSSKLDSPTSVFSFSKL